ncbi:MAG: hypothetical protein M0Q92_12365 [Methanoregula sp.]|nr:hypothetical protein [Methanoregula sp.]
MPVAAALSDDTVLVPASSSTPADADSFTIKVFILSSSMIHSDQVFDQINTPKKDVLFATSYGLSLYNGTWSTRHLNRENVSEGLMDDFITALEYDHNGNLWIGYSGGIQIYNGIWYQTLRDQQLFKDRRIKDLQRWDDDMWVATGNAGIHRYRDGAWTWYQPLSKTGPGFYQVGEMALDPASASLLIASSDNGLWIVKSPDDPVMFEQIASKDGSYGRMTRVTRDWLGGVYFFNDTSVVHYSLETGFVPVLTSKDLSIVKIGINDVSAAPDGTLYVATDDGIYIWRNGGVDRRIGRFEGAGTSKIIRTVAIDAQNRVWFSTMGYVGYFIEGSGIQNQILIEKGTSETTSKPEIPETVTPTMQSHEVAPNGNTGNPTSILAPVLDPILHALASVLSKLGIAVG